jgi:hypothetical protein
MSPFTRASPGEDPSPLVLLNDCKNGRNLTQRYVQSLPYHATESRSVVDVPGERHSTVASEDSTYPDISGNGSEFVSPFPQDILGDTKQTETFGVDTAAKSAAYASDEIYVENMWGELRKATLPPSGQATLQGSTVRSDHQVNKKLKGAARYSNDQNGVTFIYSIMEGIAEMFFRKHTHTTHNIELQERRSRDSLVLPFA